MSTSRNSCLTSLAKSCLRFLSASPKAKSMRSCVHAACMHPACGSRRAFHRGPKLTRDAQRLSMAQENPQRPRHGCSNRSKLVRFSKICDVRRFTSDACFFMVRLIDVTFCRTPHGHAASCKSPNSHDGISLRPMNLGVFSGPICKPRT